MSLLNNNLYTVLIGCIASSAVLVAEVPMPSQVPVIVMVPPSQQNLQSEATSGVSVRRATFVDPSTEMPVVYEVATFKNASGQTVEQYTNTQTGKVTSRIMP